MHNGGKCNCILTLKPKPLHRGATRLDQTLLPLNNLPEEEIQTHIIELQTLIQSHTKAPYLYILIFFVLKQF